MEEVCGWEAHLDFGCWHRLWSRVGCLCLSWKLKHYKRSGVGNTVYQGLGYQSRGGDPWVGCLLVQQGVSLPLSLIPSSGWCGLHWPGSIHLSWWLGRKVMAADWDCGIQGNGRGLWAGGLCGFSYSEDLIFIEELNPSYVYSIFKTKVELHI